MIRNFLHGLNEAARANGLSESARRALVEKYERRYCLALEAGFSAEEAIEKFGSPEKIVKDALAADGGAQSESDASENGANTNATANSNIGATDSNADSAADSAADESPNASRNDGAKNGRLNEFTVSVFDSDVKIIAVDESGIRVKVSGNVNYDSENNEKLFSFSEVAGSKKRRIFGVNEDKGGEVYIYVNKRLGFNRVDISSGGGGDIKFENFDFKTKSFTLSTISGDAVGANVVAEQKANISTISGDVTLKRFVAPALTISTISGDVIIKDATARTARMSSISGDVLVSGEIGAYKTSSISGEVTVNAKKTCETVEEMINRNLKGVAKNLNDLGKELKTQFCADDGEENED